MENELEDKAAKLYCELAALATHQAYAIAVKPSSMHVRYAHGFYKASSIAFVSGKNAWRDDPLYASVSQEDVQRGHFVLHYAPREERIMDQSIALFLLNDSLLAVEEHGEARGQVRAVSASDYELLNLLSFLSLIPQHLIDTFGSPEIFFTLAYRRVREYRRPWAYGLNSSRSFHGHHVAPLFDQGLFQFVQSYQRKEHGIYEAVSAFQHYVLSSRLSLQKPPFLKGFEDL